MKLAVLLPHWLRDTRAERERAAGLEKALSDHVATLRGLTLLLESEIQVTHSTKVGDDE